MAQQCMAPTVHRRDGTAMYGTKSTPYRWHSNVWHQQCTLQMAQQCMAPTVHLTDGTAVLGTNRAPYIWHSNVRRPQCTIQMAQQCMAPTLHRTEGTAVYGTNISPYRWHSNVWHQQCIMLWCDNSDRDVELFVAKERKVIIVHAGVDTVFVYSCLLIFKYSYKLMAVMTKY